MTPVTGLKLALLWGLLSLGVFEAEGTKMAALAGLLPATAPEAVLCGGEGLFPAAALARAAASSGCEEEPFADIKGLLPDPGACSDAAGVTAEDSWGLPETLGAKGVAGGWSDE